MTPTEQTLRIDEMVCRHFADPFRGSVADWCLANVVFDEAGNRGAFSMAGREYIREMLDDWASWEVSDDVAVMGSQSGKTAAEMAGAAWSLVNDPCAIIWGMPNRDLAQAFSETRWQPMLYASPMTKGLIPTGADRHSFKNLEQALGASLMTFIGSNSPANLASRPARKVIMDETDKFDEGSEKEADATNLLDQRTKGQPYPQRRKRSTPTIVEGFIWQEYLKGDQRRYFVPCPHCGAFILLAWSENFCAMAKQGCESYVKWDTEAKVEGKWDLDRVLATAHVECCHCKGRILDAHKPAMIKAGEWRATAKGVTGFRSRQLSSLYACSPETSFGRLAVKFLQARASLTGVQGFINGDLAEPYVGQDQSQRRTERIERVEVTAEWAKIMSVDYQQNEPFLWYVVRAWNGGNSHGLEFGSAFQFEELDAIQKKHGIKNEGVFLDSGYSPSAIYAECILRGEHRERSGALPTSLGWMPTRGVDGEKEFFDRTTKQKVKWMVQECDPQSGKSGAGQISLERLIFAADFFKDILVNLRRGKGDYKWTVSEEMNVPQYWKHMDGEKKAQEGRRWIWKLRHRHWPNHLFDCEVIQCAVANYLGLYSIQIE